MSWFGNDTKVDADCPSNAVCAYEWNGKLYHTQAEVAEAKKRKRLELARIDLIKHLIKYDPSRSYPCSSYRSGISINGVADILINDWDIIEKIVRSAK